MLPLRDRGHLFYKRLSPWAHSFLLEFVHSRGEQLNIRSSTYVLPLFRCCDILIGS